jgi:hypothetical protein
MEPEFGLFHVDESWAAELLPREIFVVHTTKLWRPSGESPPEITGVRLSSIRTSRKVLDG